MNERITLMRHLSDDDSTSSSVDDELTNRPGLGICIGIVSAILFVIAPFIIWQFG